VDVHAVVEQLPTVGDGRLEVRDALLTFMKVSTAFKSGYRSTVAISPPSAALRSFSAATFDLTSGARS